MTRILKGRGVLKRDYLHALETSREVIDAAERASRQVKAEAEERGYEDGMARAAAALAEAQMLRGRWLESARTDLACLAVEVATALFVHAREQDPTLVSRMCEEAVERVAGAGRISVRVAPSDADALRHTAVSGNLPLEVVADPSITAGGCVVESDLGSVDGRLETRTDALRQALEEVVRRHAAEEA